MSVEAPVTQLLRASQQGGAAATEQLMPLVYDRLHGIAGAIMSGERTGHTLSATALLHEAYLRICGAEIDWEGRTHFFHVAARMMRRILVDYAKARHREKRGGAMECLSLDDPLRPIQVADSVSAERGVGVLELDDALSHLARQDERKAAIIELIYFGGLTTEEAAGAMKISCATLHRELRLGKAWLQLALQARPAAEKRA